MITSTYLASKQDSKKFAQTLASYDVNHLKALRKYFENSRVYAKKHKTKWPTQKVMNYDALLRYQRSDEYKQKQKDGQMEAKKQHIKAIQAEQRLASQIKLVYSGMKSYEYELVMNNFKLVTVTPFRDVDLDTFLDFHVRDDIFLKIFDSVIHSVVSNKEDYFKTSNFNFGDDIETLIVRNSAIKGMVLNRPKLDWLKNRREAILSELWGSKPSEEEIQKLIDHVRGELDAKD